MPAVADYKVLRDATFDLEEGQEHQITFDLPGALADAKLILAYQARPFAFSGLQTLATIDVGFQFQQHVDTVTIRGETVHGLWETFSRSAVNTDIPNTLVFKSTQGKVRISDVVLWFQRSI